MEPQNAIAAVCHPGPYPYYRRLLAEPALHFNHELKLWIASRAEVIQDVFANPHCTVRPAAEVVPKALAGSSAGAVFGNLIRMNEGAGHARPKTAVGLALSSLDLSKTADRTRHFSQALQGKSGLSDGASLNAWMFDLPVYVVGDALGFAEKELPQLALWVADFVRCLSPLSDEAQLAAASVAAGNLLQGFRQLLQAAALQEASLLGRIRDQARLIGWGDFDAILANLIGLLSQTYEATAGLIGNSIVALRQHNNVYANVRTDTRHIESLVQEVCRFDPPVQNTRRFVTQATTVAGVALQAGDVILLLLAAAGRDPLANADPDEFILVRSDRRLLGFGHGRHRCPGQDLACTIAARAIHDLLVPSTVFNANKVQWTYRTSLNGRIPVFTNIN